MPTIYEQKPQQTKKYLIPLEEYLDAAEKFHWATKGDYLRWLTGEEPTRHRRTERFLKRLVDKKILKAIRYGNMLIYTKAKGNEIVEVEWQMQKVYHGLACTKCLVRTFRSDMSGFVIPERDFYGIGCNPEWGITYPNGTGLLFEFSTATDFKFTGRMNGKLNAYRRHFEKFEEKLGVKPVVLFVLDVPRDVVKRYVGSLGGDDGSAGGFAASSGGDRFPSDPFFFTDYQTFLSVPFGQQLTAPIYIWFDGKEYPLKKT
jgi:hypothetical protein